MTIENIIKTSGPYIGAGSTDTYPYTFRVTDEDQIRVIETTDLGVITVLTLTTHFTVTGVGAGGGGNIVRVAGNLPLNYIWYIVRVPPQLQESDYDNQGSYFPVTHENSFDLLTMIIQYQQGLLDNSIKFDPDIDYSFFDPTLPIDLEANETIIVNSGNTGFARGPTTAQINSANASAVAAAASAVVAALAAGVDLTFNSATSDSDKDGGDLWFNNATPASVTVLYIDNIDNNAASITAILDSLDDVTNAIGTAVIRVSDSANPTIYVIYLVTGAVVDETGYRSIAVTYQSGNGSFTNNNKVTFNYAISGNGLGTGDNVSFTNLTATGTFTSLGIDDNAASNAITISSSEDIGIGTVSPSAKLHVVDSVSAVTLLESTLATSIGLISERYHNSASPIDNDTLVWNKCLGNTDDGAGGITTSKFLYSDMFVVATDTTDGSEDSSYTIRTCVGGTLGGRLIIAGGLYHSAVTGTDKGDNTINFGSLYDDNVLVSCYPFDQKLDGTIVDKKWDDNVPNIVEKGEKAKKENKTVTKTRTKYRIKMVDGKAVRQSYKESYKEPVTRTVGVEDEQGNPVMVEVEAATQVQDAVFAQEMFEEQVLVDVPATEDKITVRTHEPMRKFKARIGTEYDPLDIDKYAQHWKDKRHLSAFPNEEKYDPDNDGSGKQDMGNFIQQLIETVEVQAIHIEGLNQRLKTLER